MIISFLSVSNRVEEDLSPGDDSIIPGDRLGEVGWLAGKSLKLVVLCVVIAVSMVLSLSFVADIGRNGTLRGSSTFSTLTVGFMEPVGTLNPFGGLNESAHFVFGAVYDTLTCVGNNLETVPNLATSYCPVPESDPEMSGMPFGTIWQYNLSQNAFWSDGVPFTADDVVWNVNLNADVANFSSFWVYQPYSFYMHQAWKVDDHTVRISFWNRTTGMPMPAAFAYLLPIHMLPKHMLENYTLIQLAFTWKGYFSDSESPGMPIVTTGPFLGTSTISDELAGGDHITLIKNPLCHWNADYGKTVNFNKLVVKIFADQAAMVWALQNKDIDVASFSPAAFTAIKSSIESGSLENVTTYGGPKMNTHFAEIEFCMNFAGPNPSRLDPVIREALHNATNKQYIIENFYLGLAEPGTTLISPTSSYWHYEPNASEMVYYNLPAAAASLESNGYIDTDADGTRECTDISPAVQMGLVAEGTELAYEMFVRNIHPEEKLIAQYLQAQWSAIGVDLTYVIVDEQLMATGEIPIRGQPLDNGSPPNQTRPHSQCTENKS